MPVGPHDREREAILPRSLQEMVPETHPAWAVAAFVDSLSNARWAEFGVKMAVDLKGARSNDPRALLSVWLLGFVCGVRSARKLEYAASNDIGYLWVSGAVRPDRNTLWGFYMRHKQAMRGAIKDMVEAIVGMGLVDLAIQAVDGTEMKANALRDGAARQIHMKKLRKLVEEMIRDIERQNKRDAEAAPYRLPHEYCDEAYLRARIAQALEEIAEDESGD